MTRKASIFVIPLAANLLACASHAATILVQQTESPTTPAQTAAPPPAASQAGGVWDVTRITCAQLLGASDDDRAAAAMFYYGYFAARTAVHVIDTRRIDQNVRHVMEQCERTPNMTVVEAFRRTLNSAHSFH